MRAGCSTGSGRWDLHFTPGFQWDLRGSPCKWDGILLLDRFSHRDLTDPEVNIYYYMNIRWPRIPSQPPAGKKNVRTLGGEEGDKPEPGACRHVGVCLYNLPLPARRRERISFCGFKELYSHRSIKEIAPAPPGKACKKCGYHIPERYE